MLAEQTRDEVFEAVVRAQLERVEAALLAAAEADSPMVTEAAQHIITAGGKRFRPLLVVLGVAASGPRAVAEDVDQGRRGGRADPRRRASTTTT